jgi:lysophospholipase L1-like esterase
MQLVRQLRARGIAVADPEFVARSGWTTDELERALVARRPQAPYDLVTLLIGVNDQYRGRSANEFQANFTSLLAHAVQAAGRTVERVIVVSVPDWGVTPFNVSRDASGVATDIDAFNAVARDGAASVGAAWANITDLGRADPAAVVEDGLHPSAAMYARWSERLVGAAGAILGLR